MTPVIDDYVSAVGSGLRGSARLREDMLTEIRDALEDAAESHQSHGAGTPEAQRLAVAEFGSAPRIAAGLQEVLALAQARRTALLLLVVLGTQNLSANLMGRFGGWQQLWGAAEPGAAYRWLAQATDVFGLLALLAAVATLVLLRQGARHPGIRQVVVRLTAVLASGVIATTLVCGSLLGLLPPQAGGAGTLAVGLGSLTASTLVLGSAWRCWHAAAPGPGRRSPARLVGS